MSDIRVIIVGKINKADWEHNFAIVDAIVDAFGGKLDASQKAAPNGVASLNSQAKVVQIALNSERLNGKTEADFVQIFIPFTAKGANGGVAELDGTGKLKAEQVPDSLSSGLIYQGSWDAEANNPEIPAANEINLGYFYLVNKAGTTTINGIDNWAVGDLIVSNGIVWEKVPNYQSVLSVNGMSGLVVLGINDIAGLTTLLDTKASLGADVQNLTIEDFNSINTPGDYFISNLSGVNNSPLDTSLYAFFTIKKSDSIVLQKLFLGNNDVYIRNLDVEGTWTNWTKIN